MNEIDDYAPALVNAKDAIRRADAAFPAKNRRQAWEQALRLQAAAINLMEIAREMENGISSGGKNEPA